MTDGGTENSVFIINNAQWLPTLFNGAFFLLWNLVVIAFAQISLYITVELKRFKASFFPSSTYIWNQIQNSSSFEIYKRALLKFIRPTSSNVYNIHRQRGLKLLTWLRLGLIHLREHKFRHNFNDTIDPFCLCRTNCLVD